ncbi:MAG: FumA C-terminus/TtdB family hydratase beta subunit [Coriobacteriales bacterium]|jgi:fumarate hydratase class I/fumarate hydratase subunit beta|nr:FumA C-terminus/TtdB family hydratase beta subunit [Coriobacteriales bacterium]
MMVGSPSALQLPASSAALAGLRVGDELRLYGTIYTMRDAGHVRALEHLQATGELPYDLAGQALFYAGPSEPAAGRPFGAIGPTTASRMDFATPALLRAGITVTLGKGPRSPEVRAACAQTGSVYLAAVGGAAALLASHVTAALLVAWSDLGPEALRRLTLEGLPAFVAIDAQGNDLFQQGRGGDEC